MIKFLQFLSLKSMLSKLSWNWNASLRYFSNLDESKKKLQSSYLNQYYENNERIRILEQKSQELKKYSAQDYLTSIEEIIQLMQNQLQLIHQIIEDQDQRTQIKFATLKTNLYEKAANQFYEIWQIDSANVVLLRKYLDITQCYKGNLSDQYLLGLCKWAQITEESEELIEIYSQLTKNRYSETQKMVAMTLFMLTAKEQYYEDILLNISKVQDEFLQLKFHLFSAQYFSRENCHYTKQYHLKKCETMQQKYQREVAQSNVELQLSFMQKYNHL